MTALFINASVDPVDPHGDWVKEDLSVNEMETILEIVAEQILDIEDCFEERDEDDSEGSTVLKPVKDLSQYEPKNTADLNIDFPLAEKQLSPDYYMAFRPQFIREVVSPPPKPAA